MTKLWLGCAALCLLLGAPASAATSKVIVTIDVESKSGIPLPSQLDAVCADGRPCGLSQIVKIFKARGISATFFLNVYEHTLWGEARLRSIAQMLQAAGHEVALHTHPETAFDPHRAEMYQYTLAEQTAIVREGVRRLHDWTGQPVVSHRAGDYSADQNTLKALSASGISFDSSVFPGHPSCRLNSAGFPINLPTKAAGLTEIPVTVYERQEHPAAFSAIFRPNTAIRKIDPDWFLNPDEATAAIDAVLQTDSPVVVMFLHSFSFIAGPGQNGTPIANRRSEENLARMLDTASARGLRFVTMRDLAETPALATASMHESDLPRAAVHVRLDHYLWHRYDARSRAAVAAGAGLTSIAGIVVFAVRRRRRAGVPQA